MKREIERKFLIKSEFVDSIKKNKGFKIKQGYLSNDPVVRIRLVKSIFYDSFNFHDYASGFLTIKGPGLINHSEFETQLQYSDAKELYETLTKNKISKTRYIIPDLNDKNINWEVDFFEEENEGLVIAEVELPSENYRFDKPEWLSYEITNQPAYSNSNLAKFPIKFWSDSIKEGVMKQVKEYNENL